MAIYLTIDKASSDSFPQNPVPVHAESFYFDDDPMAIFLVENELFKVHRHYFIQASEIFRDMFSQAEGMTEGMSDENPIVLSGVTVKEFRTLLRYFYAMTLPMASKETLSSTLRFDYDEKLALLSIAHRFVFDHIFKYILGEIDVTEMPVANRVRLYDKYGLGREWLRSAYKTILLRPPTGKLSQEEADALGLERAVKILEARNAVWYIVYLTLKEQLPNPAERKIRCFGCKSEWSCQKCQQNPPEERDLETITVEREIEIQMAGLE